MESSLCGSAPRWQPARLLGIDLLLAKGKGYSFDYD
jgi:hypothetical protein